MTEPDFNTSHDPLYAKVEQVSPLIRRITAKNANVFTFKGTGTYIVGTKSVAVIDPGPKDKKHIRALAKALKECEVSHILVTHTHRDHSPGARMLQKKTGGIICGFGPHPPESEDIEGDEEPGDREFLPDKFLAHGDFVVGQDWTIEALHTPGHISNHLCFVFREEQALFSGDHVMGWSTSIIPPPNGSLEDYLDSLRLLLDRDEVIYWPTHGAGISNPQDYVKQLLEHREKRSQQILECISGGPKTIPEIVSIIYADYPKELHKPAGRSVLAHLIYLEQQLMAGSDTTLEPEPKYFLPGQG